MLKPEYPIETARLALRPFSTSDLDDLYAMQSRTDVTQFLLHDGRTRSEVRAVLDVKTIQSALNMEGETLSLAVTRRGDRTVIGEIVLVWLSSLHRQGEIGFVFHPDYHGQGFAREAAEAGLRLGFERLGLHRIIGRCDARNLPSAQLMERLGMRREAHLVHNEIFKGEWGDELVYALLEDEWKAQRAVAGSQASR